MGTVHSAVLQGQDVAAKKLHCFENLAQKGITSRAQLLLSTPYQEIKSVLGALQSIEHPLIAKFHGVNVDEEYGEPIPRYLVTEFLGTLSPLSLVLSSVDLKGSAEIAWQLSCALVYLNTKGVVHSNIQPSNIFVDVQTWAIKVTDFGLSAVALHDSQAPTLGSVSYLAPEADVGPITTAVDVYALGCVVLAMLLGTHPPHDHTHRVRAIERSRFDDIYIKDCVADCMHFEPKDRRPAKNIRERLNMLLRKL